MYAIIDVETTGGQYNQEGITDVAIYRFDGERVTDQFITLINPDKPIQEYVVKLTGITNKMLKGAPRFYEVAKRIVEITQGCTIVAHNADFDYRMLVLEFKRLGYEFKRDIVCSVKLSQRLFPELESYSLGKLTKALGIPHLQHHRAQADALATLELFKLLLTKDTSKEIITQYVKNHTPENMSGHLLKILEEIPAAMGVYYMHNQEGNILFIGQGKNMYARVNQHFTSKSKRDAYLQKNTAKVTYELTGNELIAQIKEAEEIQAYLPALNGRKSVEVCCGLFLQPHKAGYLVPYVDRLSVLSPMAYAVFTNLAAARSFLLKLQEKYHLCDSIKRKSKCKHYDQGVCDGACIGDLSPEDFNLRVMRALSEYTIAQQSFLLIGKGRTLGEKSVVWVEDGSVRGYGFTMLNYQLINSEILLQLLVPTKGNLTITHLVHQYLLKHPKEEKMPLPNEV